MLDGVAFAALAQRIGVLRPHRQRRVPAGASGRQGWWWWAGQQRVHMWPRDTLPVTPSLTASPMGRTGGGCLRAAAAEVCAGAMQTELCGGYRIDISEIEISNLADRDRRYTIAEVQDR